SKEIEVQNFMKLSQREFSQSTAVLACILLDRRVRNQISYQAYNEAFKDSRVEDRFVHPQSMNSPRFKGRRAIDQFKKKYILLDWSKGGPIGRLKQLRNHGLVHLLDAPVGESVTYDELGSL